MAIHNTDDHLRNHGFLLKGYSFVLSPVYDINPSPFGENLSLCIDESDSLIDPQTVIATSLYYDIPENDAVSVYNAIVKTVNENWQKTAVKYGISRKSMEDMKSAFSLKEIE